MEMATQFVKINGYFCTLKKDGDLTDIVACERILEDLKVLNKKIQVCKAGNKIYIYLVFMNYKIINIFLFVIWHYF